MPPIQILSQGIRLENITNFNLTHIFECGQCFRWNKQNDGSYVGVAFGKIIQLFYENNHLTLLNTTEEEFKNFWYDYFDLHTDYHTIKEILSKDSILKTAIDFGHGIRLLRQELSEMIVSFIISSNNHIPRIKTIIDTLCQTLGDPLKYQRQEYYSFPPLDVIASSAIEKINECKAGYRCQYIWNSAKMLSENKIILHTLKNLPTIEARKQLMHLPGVGQKVADCILLFSGLKRDVFPTDVWVRKVMKALYFGYEPTPQEIQEFASNRFGDLAGYAQQYLFYYARSHGIGA